MHQQVNCCKPADEFGQRCDDGVISKTLIVKEKRRKACSNCNKNIEENKNK